MSSKKRSAIAVDEAVWDDTALLKAYDDALKGRKRVSREVQHTGTPVETEAEDVADDDEGEVDNGIEVIDNVTANVLAPRAPDVAPQELREVLQAYFDAGVALGRYLERHKPSTA